MRKLFLISAFLITACAAETPNQRFYEAVSNYSTVQKVAIDYKTECYANKLPDNCFGVVKDIQTVDKRANTVIQSSRGVESPNYEALTYQMTTLSLELAKLIRGL